MQFSFVLRSQSSASHCEKQTCHQSPLLILDLRHDSAVFLFRCARICARRYLGCFGGVSKSKISYLKKRISSKRALHGCLRLFKDAVMSTSYCRRFLSVSNGHGLCVQCLGHAHAETTFVCGSCSHCKSMTIGKLRSRLSYVFKRLRASTATSRPGPSTSGYEAMAASTEGDLGLQ